MRGCAKAFRTRKAATEQHETKLVSAAQYSRSLARRPSLRLRHRRHLRHHSRANADFPSLARRFRHHRFCRGRRSHLRLHARRHPRRPLRTPRQPARPRGLVPGLCARLRHLLELDLARSLPLHRWPGHRRLIRARPDVHRRSGSRKMARPPRGPVSIQYRARHPPRLFLELSCRRTAPRRRRMALETRRSRRPSPAFLPASFRDSAQPPLAG